ncbi:uncharacterized protein FOMMEDRAFT_106841 [Fomitiporia mediterranea MF3/22]|uniref:uncharacterized protein n=1 Tax=Fomitiporia mediterranea (strain MF3/22) TaxID=694068 RepID=UPI0004409499|nr:uncharacterized protein FOMMEDRAFT_106841 [Fomitiporia mediterranea MF3/22]EJD04259.1 hypothetical protein FOMMEDRAFT_106841 [Fomitiporia mediterranea MF3/22]
MDELLRHCLQELAFDGDLGCNAFRLRDFVQDFYSSRSSMQQNLDDSYHAFVWTLVSQHPSVRVGIVPDDQNVEVKIPPQPRVSKKGKSTQNDAQTEGLPAASLETIPGANMRSLDELVREYGERLRIAVDPEMCFVAVTGSHARPAKLTPMVYASLQLIARAREAGISVLELGRTTGYDQKTCFYVVKQLRDLDLIVKLRRGGNSQNFCVHKYVFDRSSAWKNVREEELRAQEESAEADRQDSNITGAGTGSLQLPHFDPIDTRHLTSLNILRQRLTKLLKHSLNYTQPYANISMKIGFRPRSRTDRRFFIARLKELINEGAIEKFFMTSQNPDTTQNKQLYIRLAPSDRAGSVAASEKGVKIADEEEDMIDNLVTDDGPEQAQVKCTLTLHRQILDALQESGTTGATLSDLCDQLGSFDKRTLELLVSRMERQAPPPHLADLSIVQVLETHGRERRYRVFVLSAYSELVTREGFETPSTPYSLEDLSKAGGFLETNESDFYETRDDLRAFYKEWSGARVHRLSVFDDGGGKAQKGAKNKLTEDGTGQSQRASKKKWTNPILPDGTRKRGRPPKNSDAASAARQGKKAKKDATVPPQSSEAVEADSLNQAATSVSGATLGRGVKRKRGEAEEPGMMTSTSGREADSAIVPSQGSSKIPQKRKRGRPPKQKPTTEVGVERDERDTTEVLAYPLGSTTSLPDEMHPDSIGQVSQAAGGSASPGASTSTPVPENHSHQHPSGESESVLRPQTISDNDRLAPQFDSRAYHSTSPGVTEVDTAARLLMVPEPSSNDLMGQTGGIDEVTRAIASLAAQINDSISSSLPYNEGEDSSEMHLTVVQPVKADGKSKGGESMIKSDAPDIVEGTGTTGMVTVAENSTATHAPSAPDNLENTDPSALVSTQKRMKGASGDRERANLSAMRRENELVQLIENLGGIVNTSTNEFQAAYLDFIETIIKAGEGASAPVGTRMDKRTLRYSLDKLEASGRIKVFNTSIPYITGGHRNAKIAYLPTVSEERLHAYIAEHRNAGIVVPRRQEQIREQAKKEIEEDPNSPLGLAHRWLYLTNAHEIYQERWHRNVDRAQQLLSHSDDVIREAMLMEKQTLSQQYGYVTGKVARARELHLGSIELLERENRSSFIISRQHRIVGWQFFENDITLGVYCACVSSTVFREDIRDAIATTERRNKPVKDIPDEWKQALQIGRARSRERISDLLDYLYSLKLVVPLRRTERDDSSKVRDPKADGNPDSNDFEPLPSDWASRIPVIRPEYWQFCTNAPLYFFALQKDPAPFWKTVPTLSGTEAATFWEELKEASLNKKRAEEAQHELLASTVLHDPYSGEYRVAIALRRSSSWTSEYTFSWYQVQYLKQFINVRTGSTPLDDDEQGASHLERISHVISAPIETVKAYYESSRASTQRDIDKMKQKQKKEKEEKKEAEMKSLLARKGLEAIRSREAAWDAMVERVHPGLVKGVAAGRLRRLRQSYVRGNVVQDTHQWEVQISDAIKAAEKMRSSRNLFSKAQVAREFDKAKLGPHATITTPGVSVESLIDMQKDLVHESGRDDGSEVTAPTSRSKSQRDKGAEYGRKRRQRFQWSAEYDELLRDAYVILRARCRTHYRLEWTALDQVFPSLRKNSVRARLLVLKEQPGAEAYLHRLENCWHDLWIKNRGTPELPDRNPQNPTEFDLKAHLEYLREHVDKNSIRVGVSALEEKEYTPLSASMEDFVSSWVVEERKAAHDSWDFLTNYALGEEAREKLVLESAFVVENVDPPSNVSHSDQLSLAESALKMVIGTPDESYDSNRAAALLHGIGEDEISTAMENLLSRNVFSKMNRDPSRLVPGRTVKISEMNQNALSGPISKDLFLDASQLEESFEAAKTDQWEWPFTATDGDTAAILQLFSDHRAEFEVDTSRAQAARPAVEGNSRKVDDDDIELGVQIKLSGMASCESEQAQLNDEPDSIEIEDTPGHGATVLGEQACCGICSDGVVDCLKCIEDAQTQLNSFSENDKHIAESIVQNVDARSERGITIEELKGIVAAADGSLASIIHQLHTSRVPRVYVTGYDSTFVVSAKYIGSWTITLPGEDGPLTKVFPRRWLDITGDRISMVWEAGLRAVVGLVHLRPGISQAELRWRLRAVYDRREVIDLLNHLMSSGTLKVFHGGSWQRQKSVCIDALTKDEETTVFWAVNEDKRWYHI